MLTPLKALWSSVVEYYYDLPRMVLLNIFWFITALPALLVALGIAQLVSELTDWQQLVLNVWIVPVVVVVLALFGPGTAAIYYVTNRLANGELLEIMRFWHGFRHFFWRGWALATLNVGAGTLLVLNVVFYWTMGGIGLKLLSVVFAYLLVLWFAIQGYLFALMVELDQSIRLVVRNALFLAIDNLGLTLGLLVVNVIVILFSVPPWSAALLLPLATMTIASYANNKVVVEAVDRYRAAGRILKDT